ncbi:DUF6660 family protein [Flavobacterium sp. HSC-61S13]|uniref:DUF6660 family protein n=1 Tax=Flavobacterium sp. HSC-61S13 TaxID=2910963 RepID=UPI0020A12C71|nr:DUF6660 family protein [Flavobacterium sp. HSC-61S13]MCP1996829.1 hypothetical protein [Flavobacterium sp. HSC-61S13]
MKKGRQIVIMFISVLLLVLALLPCADKKTVTAMEHTLTQVSTSSHQHVGMDKCSPFCVCNCCTSPIMIKNNVFFEQFTFPKTTLKSPDYYQSFVITVFHFIWKPPRIVYFN